MRATLALAIAAALLAGASHAQSDPEASAGPPPPVPQAKADRTVSGVTVTPTTRKPCKPRDNDCIAMVMTQVKAQYPEQLKAFCFQQKMDVMRQDMQANIAGWCEGPNSASTLCHHAVSPVVKQVCAPDKK